MKIRVLLIGVIIIAVGVFGYIEVSRFVAIDSCLDKGCKWNYEKDSCECLGKIEKDSTQ